MNDDLDGNTCIPIALTPNNDATDVDPTSHFARLWCVADSLLYIRIYRDDNHDNCMWTGENGALSQKPVEPGDDSRSSLMIVTSIHLFLEMRDSKMLSSDSFGCFFHLR